MEDPSRGDMFTNALYGVKAKEVHICGSQDALSQVVQIMKHTGDELTVHNYGRLSTLTIEDDIVNLRDLKSGDAIVMF